MFKRIAAISLISLANIIMLAMVVLPHHHHGEQVCFNVSHCVGGHRNHGYDDVCGEAHHRSDSGQPGHSHTHDDACMIGQWLLVDANTVQKHELCRDCVFCTDHHLYTADILSEFREIIIPISGLPLKVKPFINNYKHTFVSRIHGLRAPPFC